MTGTGGWGEGRGSPKSAALGRGHCRASLRLLQSPPGGRGGAGRLGGWAPRTSHSTTVSSGKQRPICTGCRLRVWGSICPAGLARGSWLRAGSGTTSSAPSQDLGWCLCRRFRCVVRRSWAQPAEAAGALARNWRGRQTLPLPQLCMFPAPSLSSSTPARCVSPCGTQTRPPTPPTPAERAVHSLAHRGRASRMQWTEE